MPKPPTIDAPPSRLRLALSKPGCLPVGVGVALVVMGIPMLICPGPGIGSILLGVSLIGVGLGVKRRSE